VLLKDQSKARIN